MVALPNRPGVAWNEEDTIVLSDDRSHRRDLSKSRSLTQQADGVGVASTVMSLSPHESTSRSLRQIACSDAEDIPVVSVVSDLNLTGSTSGADDAAGVSNRNDSKARALKQSRSVASLASPVSLMRTNSPPSLLRSLSPRSPSSEKRSPSHRSVVAPVATGMLAHIGTHAHDVKEEAEELLEVDGFHVPHQTDDFDDEDFTLSMIEAGKTYVKKYLTPLRLGVLLVLLTLSVLGIALVDEKEFSIKVTVPNVRDVAGCRAMCEKTLSDSDFAATLGGEGVCTTVEFKNCTTKSKYPKLKLDCKSSSNTPDSSRCRFEVTPAAWKPYVTMIIFVLAAEGCFQSGPPAVLLLGAGCIFTALGIISRGDLFSGMTNSGVLGLAVLSPIAAAIGDSGIMEKMVGVMLGSPQSFGVALFRMMMPVALLSAFLSNTATVAILIPIVVSWSRRLEVHPGQLLMPLSFAAQLGGSMTLLGSSHCLVAKGAIPSDTYDMQFFDLAPIGAMLTLLTSVAIWLVLKFTTLLRSSADAKIENDDTDDGILDVYDMDFQVESGGGLVGKTLDEVGLERLPGVVKVELTRGASPGQKLHGGDVLSTMCTERGVVQLRKVPGILPTCCKELSALGRCRHHRFLYEVGIRPETKIFAAGLPSSEELRLNFVAAYVAGPKRTYVPESPQASKEERRIQENSVLLLEADSRAVANKAIWAQEFQLIHKVHFSSPPRQGLPVDRVRSICTFLGFVILIVLCTLKVVKLDYGGGLLCLWYLFIQSLTVKDFMKSFNPSILGTIVGALAMGNALERSGFVNFLANTMIKAAEPVGDVGIYVMIYIVSWLMGLVINNSAIVAILGPMLISVTEKDENLKIEGLVWMLVYAAGTCFTTPLGYQTNLMVIPEGKYTFGDFARFGITIQAFHCVCSVILILIFSPMLAA